MEQLRKEVIDDLKSIPQILNDKATSLYAQKQLYDETKLVLKTIERNTYLQVEAELDDNAKPRFSNDTKRKAETESRLREDENYQAQSVMAESLRKELDAMQQQIDFIVNRFRAARALSRII